MRKSCWIFVVLVLLQKPSHVLVLEIRLDFSAFLTKSQETWSRDVTGSRDMCCPLAFWRPEKRQKRPLWGESQLFEVYVDLRFHGYRLPKKTCLLTISVADPWIYNLEKTWSDLKWDGWFLWNPIIWICILWELRITMIVRTIYFINQE